MSITCLQYNILSLAKRFSDYETIGELFRGTVADAQEVAFAERIMESKNWTLYYDNAKTNHGKAGRGPAYRP